MNRLSLLVIVGILSAGVTFGQSTQEQSTATQSTASQRINVTMTRSTTAPSPAQQREVEQNLKDVHFAFDRYDLDDHSRRTLRENADWLKANPGVVVSIAGDADERGDNNWDFNVLGTIFEKKTGTKIGQAFYERIAKPIGMQDFSPDDVFYLGGTESIHPAYLFEISARDLARFGLLYLRHGRWENKQIIPEDWVEKSTHANEMVNFGGKDAGGYEYLWWWNMEGNTYPRLLSPECIRRAALVAIMFL